MPEGVSPLDHYEMQRILIDPISTQAKINFAEQQSINESSNWIFQTNHNNILTDQFLKSFQSVWVWAGKYRMTNKNNGVESYKILTEIKNLCDDCEY